MDTLPYTILEDIIDLARFGQIVTLHEATGTVYVARKSSIANIAAVNNTFRHIAERKTFEELQLTAGSLPRAYKILSRYGRFAYVKHITFVVLLPRYDQEACTRYETAEEKIDNSQMFTQCVELLFSFLRVWPRIWMSQDTALCLSLEVNSPTDLIEMEHTDLNEEHSEVRWCPIRGVRKQFGVAIEGDCFQWRYIRSTLNLTRDTLSSTYRVRLPISHFEVSPFTHRFIGGASLNTITSALDIPALKSVMWEIGDCEKKDLARRIKEREDAARAIDDLPALDQVTLCFEHHLPLDHDFNPAVVHDPNSRSDPVSCALRRVTQRSKVVRFGGVLGSTELFWPIDRSPESEAPQWELLESLTIDYHIATPDGRWMFTSDEDMPQIHGSHHILLEHEPKAERAEEDAEPYQWRHKAIPKIMDTFYLRAAQAMANMPKLQAMKLVAMNLPSSDHTKGGENFTHKFSFIVGENRRASALWETSRSYLPSRQVRRAWEKSAYERSLEVECRVRCYPTASEEDYDYHSDTDNDDYDDDDADYDDDDYDDDDYDDDDYEEEEEEEEEYEEDEDDEDDE